MCRKGVDMSTIDYSYIVCSSLRCQVRREKRRLIICDLSSRGRAKAFHWPVQLNQLEQARGPEWRNPLSSSH